MNKKNKPLFLVLISLQDSKSWATKSSQESPSALTSYPSIEVPQTLVKDFQMIQESRGRFWGRVCSINTLLRGTGSLWWLILWVASSHHEICEGCSLLPFRSELDLKTRHLFPSWNLMPGSLNLESSFASENEHEIISWKTTNTAS